MPFSPTHFSRRHMLQLTVAAGGAVVAATMPDAAAASSKVAKSAVAYQATPKGKAQCDNCAQWQGHGSCKLVSGVISPSGWCSIYFAKA